MLEFYIIFALATAIMAMLELWSPVIKQLELQEEDSLVVQYKKSTFTIFFVLSLITAPLIFVICMVPSKGQRFRESFLGALKD